MKVECTVCTYIKEDKCQISNARPFMTIFVIWYLVFCDFKKCSARCKIVNLVDIAKSILSNIDLFQSIPQIDRLQKQYCTCNKYFIISSKLSAILRI